MNTSDEFLLAHAKAVNAAIHALARAIGTSVTGLPEPSESYAKAATLADVLGLRDNVQAAMTEIADRVNDIAAAIADVAARPPVSVVVPVPDVEVNVAIPERPSTVTFARDGAGRIIGAEKTPA